MRPRSAVDADGALEILFVLYCLQLRLIPYQMTATKHFSNSIDQEPEPMTNPNFLGSFSISSCDVPALCTGWLHSAAHSLSFRSDQRRRVPAAPRRVDRSRHQGRPAATLLYITLFHQLNGSIKICKRYINKYNTTTKNKEKRRRKNKNLG